jgi:hypothetical protein
MQRIDEIFPAQVRNAPYASLPGSLNYPAISCLHGVFQMQWLKVCEIMGERLNLLVAERIRDICHRRDSPADAHV